MVYKGVKVFDVLGLNKALKVQDLVESRNIEALETPCSPVAAAADESKDDRSCVRAETGTLNSNEDDSDFPTIRQIVSAARHERGLVTEDPSLDYTRRGGEEDVGFSERGSAIDPCLLAPGDSSGNSQDDPIVLEEDGSNAFKTDFYSSSDCAESSEVDAGLFSAATTPEPRVSASPPSPKAPRRDVESHDLTDTTQNLRLADPAASTPYSIYPCGQSSRPSSEPLHDCSSAAGLYCSSSEPAMSYPAVSLPARGHSQPQSHLYIDQCVLNEHTNVFDDIFHKQRQEVIDIITEAEGDDSEPEPRGRGEKRRRRDRMAEFSSEIHHSKGSGCNNTYDEGDKGDKGDEELRPARRRKRDSLLTDQSLTPFHYDLMESLSQAHSATSPLDMQLEVSDTQPCADLGNLSIPVDDEQPYISLSRSPSATRDWVLAAEYQEWPFEGFLKRTRIGNETMYNLEFKLPCNLILEGLDLPISAEATGTGSSQEASAKHVRRRKAASHSKISAAPSRPQMKRALWTPEEDAKLRKMKKDGCP